MIRPAVRGLVPRGIRAEQQSPSSAIYVTEPLADLMVPFVHNNIVSSQAPAFEPGRPVRALTPNAFHARDGDGRDHAIVVRDWSAAGQRRVERLRGGMLIYVIDDDVEAGVEDASLPASYRRRLSRLAERAYRHLVRRADLVLTPSDGLAERLRARVGDRVRTISPSLTGPPATLSHHRADGPLRLIFPNTRSHRADWEVVWPAVRDFMADHPEVTLATYLGRDGRLEGVASVEHRTAGPWPQFRMSLLLERFHVALLPGLPTPFNTARSHNKLLECAVWGAVPVVSRHLPYASLVREHDTGFVCGDNLSEWRDALEALRDPALRARKAARGADFARRVGDPAIMRRRWLDLLALEAEPAPARPAAVASGA